MLKNREATGIGSSSTYGGTKREKVCFVVQGKRALGQLDVVFVWLFSV